MYFNNFHIWYCIVVSQGYVWLCIIFLLMSEYLWPKFRPLTKSLVAWPICIRPSHMLLAHTSRLVFISHSNGSIPRLAETNRQGNKIHRVSNVRPSYIHSIHSTYCFNIVSPYKHTFAIGIPTHCCRSIPIHWQQHSLHKTECPWLAWGRHHPWQ